MNGVQNIGRDRPLLALALVLAFNAVLRTCLAYVVPISYKEAYFWEWSQHLSWGYLDHPPMVAWTIAAMELVVSPYSIWAVRLFPVLTGTASLGLIYRLAYRMFSSHSLALRAVWVACSFPVLISVWLLMLPDTVMIFFTLVALNLFYDAYREGSVWYWTAFGLAIGCALLSKLAILFVVVSLIIFSITSPAVRVRVGCLLAAVAGMLIPCIPFLWWSGRQGWVNWRLQMWDRHLDHFGFSFAKLGEFCFEQVAAATPVLLPLIVLVLFVDRKQLRQGWREPFRLLAMQVACIMGFLLIAGSMITQTHPHWTSLAYPPAAIMLAVVWTEFPACSTARWIRGTIRVVQPLFVVAVIVAALFPTIIMRIDPGMLGTTLGKGLVKGQQRVFGLRELAAQVKIRMDEQRLAEDAILFTDSYRLSGQLSFTCHLPVICIPAYFSPDIGTGKGQPWYIPASTLQGKKGLYVMREESESNLKYLHEAFSRVEELEPIEHVYDQWALARYRLFKVENANFSNSLQPSR